MSKRKHPWKRYQPDSECDIRLLNPASSPINGGFETFEDAQDESTERVNVLRKGNPPETSLARKIEACDDASPCNLSCCQICMRLARIYRVGEHLRLFAPFDEVYGLVLLFEQNTLSFGQLSKLDWGPIKNRLRKQISRSLGDQVLAFGGLEVGVDYGRGLWTPHAHIFVADCSRQRLEQLRKYYPSEKQKRRKMRVDDVNSRARQFSYAHKYAVFFRPGKQTNQFRPRCVRLKPAEHNEHMLFLENKSPLDSLFTFNASRDNGVYYKLSPRVKNRKLSLVKQPKNGWNP